MNHTNCNCETCLWERIILNSLSITLTTKRGKILKYEVSNQNSIIWIPKEDTQHNLYTQSKQLILRCLQARIKNLSPSNYPGTATSYKWALLNHHNIWM